MTMRFGRFGAAAALATLLLVSPGAGANAAEPIAQASEPPWSGVVRVTLVSADIERSKRFYGQVFGYTVSFDGDITTASTQVLLSLGPRDKARFVVLNGAAELAGKPIKATSIGLIQITRTPRLPVLAQPRGNRLASGQAMLAMQTADMARVLAQLHRLGAPIVAGPLLSHNGRETEIATQDPDGTRIHVVEQR
ncbi:MAG: VOC family protein [Sphingomonas sp.]